AQTRIGHRLRGELVGPGAMQDDRNVGECTVEGRRVVECAGPELDAEVLGQGLEGGTISPGEDRLQTLRQREARCRLADVAVRTVDEKAGRHGGGSTRPARILRAWTDRHCQ